MNYSHFASQSFDVKEEKQNYPSTWKKCFSGLNEIPYFLATNSFDESVLIVKLRFYSKSTTQSNVISLTLKPILHKNNGIGLDLVTLLSKWKHTHLMMLP